MSATLNFIVPGDPAQRTGGYLYDAHIVRELRDLGWSVEVIGLEGRFPDADERALAAMSAALSDLRDGARVVIDGLALGGVPDAVLLHADRLDVTALVHHPLCDETGLTADARTRLRDSEARALEGCRRIIVTSPFTAHRVEGLAPSGVSIRVVEPGVTPAPVARPVVNRLQGREPSSEQLVCVATVTPRKGQDVLVEALAGVADRNWQCSLVGSTGRDAAFSARVSAAIESWGLSGRIHFVGECDEQALDAQYRRAGLCLLPSHYEGYGMVVSEALARGLPMITTTGGALADTAPADCCVHVPPGDPGALGDALRRWFEDEALRIRLTRNAFERRERRERLRDWAGTGREFDAALASEAD